MAAQASRNERTSTAASQEEIRQALDQVLSSKYFVHAPKKQKFLQLICDFHLSGRARELNEYLIGCEVFDRNEAYNPAADPIVRVGAHDVRKKLELYYQNEGAADEVRLEIPIGSYEPNFTRYSRPAAEEVIETTVLPSTEPVHTAPPAERGWLLALGAAVLVLLVTAAMLALSNHDLRQQVQEANAHKDYRAYGVVWEPFLQSDDPALLVLSNPPVYCFLNSGDPDILFRKSIGLTAQQAGTLSTILRDKFIVRNTPNPRLVLAPNTYTGIGEAIGLYRITDLFRTAGKSALLKQSRTLSAEDLKNHQVITLGSVWVNEWSGKLPIQEDFVYSPGATIENHHPLPGEEREYRSKFDEQTGDLLEDYALVTVKPNITSENVVMILAGIRSPGTEAAVEYITAKGHLNELNQRLRQAGGNAGPPKYYQALLRVGVENGIPTTISLLALHRLEEAGQ